ncbi:helix-turn-helix transcriptional regulator [Kribbia dieselivorans]|uniref:helix-turn-helix transcriptional regulator n=1 Tax=Kribbia dieselivorans TaxID=331526 RepID=UPI000838747F|nr:helix-turn-helix transcriptional regulator [Kribbia dieselivorans]
MASPSRTIVAQLRARAQVLLARVGELGGRSVVIGPDDDLADIDAKLTDAVARIRIWLQEADTERSGVLVVEASQCLSDLHTLRWDLRGHHIEERQRRFAVLDAGVQRMRQHIDPDVLLDGVCRAVLECGEFDRVLVSRVQEGRWRPWRSLARQVRDNEQAFVEWLTTSPEIALDPRIREGDIVDRRETVIVFPDDERTRMAGSFIRARPTTSAADRPHGSYVAAPLAPAGEVIGLIHADFQDQDVTPLDRDVLDAFARAFDQLYERAVLLFQLNRQRVEVQAALADVERVLGEVANTEIALSRMGVKDQDSHPEHALTLSSRQRATEGLAGILTPRELEVLHQMSTGATNDRIATELYIAPDTVKSHVKHILRKLRAENRAEAIAQYLRVTLGSL